METLLMCTAQLITHTCAFTYSFACMSGTPAGHDVDAKKPQMSHGKWHISYLYGEKKNQCRGVSWNPK